MQFHNSTKNMAQNEDLQSVLIFACLFLPPTPQNLADLVKADQEVTIVLI